MSATPHRHPQKWVLRALVAGIAAASVGVAIGTCTYLEVPGSASLDWCVMSKVLVAYALGTGLLGGLGAAAGMVFAKGSRTKVPLGRMLAGSTAGGALGCFAPAVIGIAGFGSISAPYAGTANISISILASAAVFVALWGPKLSDARIGPFRGLVLASIAATISAVTFALVGWAVVTSLGLVPSFDQIAAAAEQVGLLHLAIVVGAVVAAIVGAFMGLATWVYLRLAEAAQKRA